MLAHGRYKLGIRGKKLFDPVKDKRRLITLNGKTNSVSGWAKELGIGSRAMSMRLARGWSKKELALKKQQPRQVHVKLPK